MRGTEQNWQARLWPHQPHSSEVPCVAHAPFSVSTSYRKVCLTGVILTTCRNLAAILGKTSGLFYPQAFTGDWHFAELSLAPRAWCRGCPALAALLLRLRAFWKWCSGFFSWRSCKHFPALIWLWRRTSAFAAFGFLCKTIFMCSH